MIVTPATETRIAFPPSPPLAAPPAPSIDPLLVIVKVPPIPEGMFIAGELVLVAPTVTPELMVTDLAVLDAQSVEPNSVSRFKFVVVAVITSLNPAVPPKK